jgi:hypothetical protein
LAEEISLGIDGIDEAVGVSRQRSPGSSGWTAFAKVAKSKAASTTPLCSPQALLRFITDLGLGVVDPGVGHVGKDFPFEVVLHLA